jgi:hypothetical protein
MLGIYTDNCALRNINRYCADVILNLDEVTQNFFDTKGIKAAPRTIELADDMKYGRHSFHGLSLKT